MKCSAQTAPEFQTYLAMGKDGMFANHLDLAGRQGQPSTVKQQNDRLPQSPQPPPV